MESIAHECRNPYHGAVTISNNGMKSISEIGDY